MPSKATSKPPSGGRPRKEPAADFDSYLLEGDLSDNPFRSPSPGATSNKRKEPASGLGIDEEVEVKKRATVPRVKLDEARLLSQAGIPTLRQRAKGLRLKGKGHEWSDAARLLSLYQNWLDDLFPKAKFLDALAMVEKAGHKGLVRKARMDWIEEGRPKDETRFGNIDEEDDLFGDGDASAPAREPSRIAPIFEQAKRTGSGSGRREGQTTPDRDDLFGDEDIYSATPRQQKKNAAGGEPDEDDLDALMAEAENAAVARSSLFGGGGGGKPASSLFGGPVAATTTTITTAETNEPGEDDLDALMAEAEGQGSVSETAATSILGNGKGKAPGVDEEDGLEALMAEAEGKELVPEKTDAAKRPDGDSGAKNSFDDDEEAMAEMDGLW